jgi:hypothetical protein
VVIDYGCQNTLYNSATFCGGAFLFKPISPVLKGILQGYFLSFDTGVTFPSGPVTLVTNPSGAGANNTGYFVLR